MEYETPDLTVREVDDVTIVRLRHENLSGVPDLERIGAEVDALLDRGVKKLMLDFKYVRHTSSAALGLLIRLQKRVNATGGKMVLSHAEHIAELLRVSHTAGLFKLAGGPKEAFKMF